MSAMENSRTKYGVTGLTFGSMGGYYTLAEVVARLDSMKEKFPNLITAKKSIGATEEGREIYMVKISDNPDADETEPQVLYTAVHHAREPESMMQLIYFMYYLLENYNKDNAVKYLVDNRELYFVPVVNPDGYEYNYITNPAGGGMWRKNRQYNSDGSYGVDLNRNYGPFKYWDSPNNGSSEYPGSEVYRGKSPFSEKETSAIKNFIATKHFRCALNYHTFSDLLIYPYGALDKETPDSLIFIEFAQEMTKYNGYTTGLDLETVGYSTRGNSDDYMYDGDTVANGGKIFAMTPEVGNSVDGFWPAQNRIFPLAEENLYPNLFYAWVAGDYVQLDKINIDREFFNPGDDISLTPSIKNRGLSDASNIFVLLSSLSDDISVNKGTAEIGEVKSREIYNLTEPFSFTVSSNAKAEEEVKLLLQVKSNDVVMSADTIALEIGTPTFAYLDTTNDINVLWSYLSQRTNKKWDVTTSEYHSAPNCYTESKDGNYDDNSQEFLTLKEETDLAGIVNPKLSFYTKFDIETGWDYAQVKVSTDNGVNWSPLKGRYTIPGSGQFQPLNQPVYNGIQRDWVREEMNLSAYTDKKIKIRFEFNSDEAVNRDGWYLDDIGIITYSSPVVINENFHVIKHYSLSQNFPNPFNPSTEINYAVPNSGFVSLKVFNVLGAEVATLVNSFKNAGNYTITFSGGNAAKNLSSGIYFYTLKAGNFIQTKKMILLK